MSVQPGQHNIDVQRRADYDLSLQFKDSTGANLNLTGTFDTGTANGMTLGTVNAFAVKNTSGSTRLMQIYGSMDAKTVTGNNKILGIKLAKNGTPIDQTECRAFTSSGGQEAKLVTNWIISMAANDEVALFIANHSGTEDITFGRGRLVATQVPA